MKSQHVLGQSGALARCGVCRFQITVAAAPLAVVHYTVDLDNASCGLTLSMAEVAYSGRMLMNQPDPGHIRPSMSAIARKRWMPFPSFTSLFLLELRSLACSKELSLTRMRGLLVQA